MLHDLGKGGNVDTVMGQDTKHQVQITCHAPLCYVTS